MKTIKLKSSILASACALLALFPNLSPSKNGSLKEIVKPYLGVYECKNAQLGEKDLLAEFSYIHLELKDKGEFILYYNENEGKKIKTRGKYTYDEKTQTITMEFADGKSFKRDFPLKNGQLIVSLPLGKEQLCLIFEQK